MNKPTQPLAPLSALRTPGRQNRMGNTRSLVIAIMAVGLAHSAATAQQLETGQLTPRPKSESIGGSEIEALAKKSDQTLVSLARIGPKLQKAIDAYDRDPSEANAQALRKAVAESCAVAGPAMGSLAEAQRRAGQLAAGNAKQCTTDAQLLRQLEGDATGQAATYNTALEAGTSGLQAIARSLRERGVTSDADIKHEDRLRIHALLKATGASQLAHKWLKNEAEVIGAARRHLETMATRFSEQAQSFGQQADGFLTDQKSFGLIASSISKTTAAIAMSQKYWRDHQVGEEFRMTGAAVQDAVSHELDRLTPPPVMPNSVSTVIENPTGETGIWKRLLRFVGVEPPTTETPQQPVEKLP